MLKGIDAVIKNLLPKSECQDPQEAIKEWTATGDVEYYEECVICELCENKTLNWHFKIYNDLENNGFNGMYIYMLN